MLKEDHELATVSTNLDFLYFGLSIATCSSTFGHYWRVKDPNLHHFLLYFQSFSSSQLRLEVPHFISAWCLDSVKPYLLRSRAKILGAGSRIACPKLHPTFQLSFAIED